MRRSVISVLLRQRGVGDGECEAQQGAMNLIGQRSSRDVTVCLIQQLRQALGAGLGCAQRADDAWAVYDVGDVIPADRDALVPAIGALQLRPQRLDLGL